jgi:hypothetical protein
MFTLTPFLNLIIPGFVYEVDAFLAFLLLTHVRNIQLDWEQFRHYLFYVALASVFFNIVLGLAIDVLMEKAVVSIYPSLQYTRQTFSMLNAAIPDRVRESMAISYRDLVMLRHLTVGVLVLAIVLPWWLARTSAYRFARFAFFSCLAMFLIFAGAYCVRRQVHSTVMQAIQSNYAR